MPSNPNIIEALDSAGRGLRAAFVWWNDRFGHVISVVSKGSRSVSVLNSTEGDGRDGWPPSPPLQSLSIEELADGKAALLVGMAGRSHWSASVEAAPGRPELTFDVACRLGQIPAKLGSRYSVASGDIISPRGDKERDFIELQVEGHVLRLSRVEFAGTTIALRLPEPDRITIRPKPVEKSMTVRWKYRVELLAPPGKGE